jgi:hypothetical protein
MAASPSYLPYAAPVLNTPAFRKPSGEAEQIHLVPGFHRLLLRFACPFHSWNWPRPIQSESPARFDAGFDAHQTCFKCTVERLYNTTRLEAGPLYRTHVPGDAETPFNRLGLLLKFLSLRFADATLRAMRVLRRTPTQAIS